MKRNVAQHLVCRGLRRGLGCKNLGRVSWPQWSTTPGPCSRDGARETKRQQTFHEFDHEWLKTSGLNLAVRQTVVMT